MPFVRLAPLAALPFLWACGKKVTSVTTTELEGSWIVPCGPPGTGGSGSARQSITFQQLGYVHKYEYFTDTNCATANVAWTTTGSFAPGGAARSPAGAKKIDFTGQSVTVTTANGGAAQLNSTWNCPGITFQDGTPADVTGAKCSNLIYFIPKGSTWFDVYGLGGTSLQVGAVVGPTFYDENDHAPGVSDFSRPGRFNTTYTKQ